jgi:FkbM family methyltransferase
MPPPLTSEEAAVLRTAASSYLKRPELPLLARILKAYYRTNLRGRTRLTLLLARRMKSLQAVPIRIADWPAVFVDLRLLNSHFWLIGTPFAHSPIELDEQIVMRRFVRAGDTVFDIGANIGVHTALLAQLTGSRGHVFAFEPNADLLPALALTIGGLQNATLFPYALSDDETETEFFVPGDNSMGSLSDWTRHARAIRVTQRRIDGLVNKGLIPVPDFIKCDVEGAELKVFRGATETLDRADAPVVLFEAGPESAGGFGFAMTDAAEFLAALPRPGYRFFEVGGGGTLQRVRPADLKKQNQNVLAVPRDRHPDLT